jgi:hypothetical protein
MGVRVPEAQRRPALHGSALAGLALRLEPVDARLPQRLADRGRAHLSARAPVQLARHFLQRRARLLTRDRAQRFDVLRVQRRLAPDSALICSVVLHRALHPFWVRSEHRRNCLFWLHPLRGCEEIVASGSSSPREAQPYKGTVSIAGAKSDRAADLFTPSDRIR